MAALKPVYATIFFIVLTFQLGSSVRVLTEKKKDTNNGLRAGLADRQSFGGIPFINIGTGDDNLGNGNNGNGNCNCNGNGNNGNCNCNGNGNGNGGGASFSLPGISIPGISIPGLVIGVGGGGGCSSGGGGGRCGGSGGSGGSGCGCPCKNEGGGTGSGNLVIPPLNDIPDAGSEKIANPDFLPSPAVAPLADHGSQKDKAEYQFKKVAAGHN